jgi:hypothetical protein
MFQANYRITYDAYGASGHLLSHGYILPTGERCEFTPGYNPAEDGFFVLSLETIQLAKRLKIESNFDAEDCLLFTNESAKIKHPIERVEYWMSVKASTLYSFTKAYCWVNQRLIS